MRTKRNIFLVAATAFAVLCFIAAVFCCFKGGKVFAESGFGYAQNYKGGKVKLPDYIFDENKVAIKTVDEVYAEQGEFSCTVYNDSTGNYDSDVSLDVRNTVKDIFISEKYVDALTVKTDTVKVGAGEITGLFIKNGNIDGKDRWHFAYIGVPEKDKFGNPIGKTNPAPAVVCIQGAGGTAFSEWVTYWMSKGYAAISIDTEGGVPQLSGDKYGRLDTHSARPDGLDGFYLGKSNLAFTDCVYGSDIESHWFYQALSSIVASTTYLRSLPIVDRDRIAVTGISYGSYMTCLAAAYDGRYVCAVPIYGSLEQQSGDTWFSNNIKRYPYAGEIWDSNNCLKGNKVPIYYLASDTDPHFSIESTSLSLQQVPYSRAYYSHEFPHSHSVGVREDIIGYAKRHYNYSYVVYDFVDSCCYGTGDYAKYLDAPNIAAKPIEGYRINGTQSFGEEKYYYAAITVPNGRDISDVTVRYTKNDKLINNSDAINCDFFCTDRETIDPDRTGYYNGDTTYILGNIKHAVGRQSLDIYGDYYYQYRTMWSDLEGESIYCGTDGNGDKIYVLRAKASDRQILDGCTFYFFEFTDSKNYKMSTQLADMNKIPDYYYKLNNSSDGTLYDFAQDENGWANNVSQGDVGYNRFIGSDSTHGGVYFAPQNDGSGEWVSISSDAFGVKASKIKDGESSLLLENNYTVDFTAFNVYEPIIIKYKVTELGESTDFDGVTAGAAWYDFALFDDVQKALVTATNGWNTSGSYYNYYIGAGVGRFDTSLNSAEKVAPKLSLMGSNAFNGGDWEDGLFGKLRCLSYDFATGENFDIVREITADADGYYTVTVDIGESKTTVTVNGEEIYSTDCVTRKSFKWSKVYLSLASCGYGENADATQIDCTAYNGAYEITPQIEYYKVELKLDGGSLSQGKETFYYEKGVGAELPTDVIKEGYTFIGWTATNSVDDVDYITAITDTDEGDKIFYAKYQKNEEPQDEPQQPQDEPEQPHGGEGEGESPEQPSAPAEVKGGCGGSMDSSAALLSLVAISIAAIIITVRKHRRN